MNTKRIAIVIVIILLFVGVLYSSIWYFGKKGDDEIITVRKEDEASIVVLNVREDIYEFLKDSSEKLRESVEENEESSETNYIKIRMGVINWLEENNLSAEEKGLLYELYSSNSDFKIYNKLKDSKDMCPGIEDVSDYKIKSNKSLENIENCLVGEIECLEEPKIEADKELLHMCSEYSMELEKFMKARKPLEKGMYANMIKNLDDLDYINYSKLEKELINQTKNSLRNYLAYSLNEDKCLETEKYLELSKENFDRSKVLLEILSV